jgi:hypothetical protein
MAVEDEYCLTYKNEQIREADGWQMTRVTTDHVSKDDYYIKDHRVVTPVPVQQVVSSVWTPNSFEAFSPDPPWPKMRRFIF